MTRLQTLARRRELVLISCDLQRFTLATRLEGMGRRPAHAWLSSFASLGRQPWVRAAALAVAARVLKPSPRPAKGT